MMYQQRICIISFQSQTHHTTKFPRKCIPYYRYYPDSTQRYQRKSNTVVSGYYHKIFRLVFDYIIHLRYISGCLLDRHDIIKFTGQTQSSLCCHIHTGTTGHIIKNNGKFSCRSNRFIMLIDTLLRRFIIIRYDRQYGIYTLKRLCLQTFHYSSRIVST